MACSEVAFLQTAGAGMFSSQCHNSIVFAVWQIANSLSPITRGGVEDTRLEAKAKDTKKIRGQGQPFRGQTLSRPRTDALGVWERNPQLLGDFL